jgi:hypothetical protein
VPRDFLPFSSFSTYLQPVAASVSGINSTAKRKTQSCRNLLLPLSATSPTILSLASVTIEEPKLRNVAEIINNFVDKNSSTGHRRDKNIHPEKTFSQKSRDKFPLSTGFTDLIRLGRKTISEDWVHVNLQGR